MKIEPVSSLKEVIPLLADCDLETSDIATSLPARFFGIRDSGTLVAVVGLEDFGSVGLLRSLAVAPACRGRGLAAKLVAFAEANAAAQGIESLYLLTTTAAPFFSKRGYVPASRQDAPQAIRATAQFSGLCPASSTFLSKRLASG